MSKLFVKFIASTEATPDAADADNSFVVTTAPEAGDKVAVFWRGQRLADAAIDETQPVKKSITNPAFTLNLGTAGELFVDGDAPTIEFDGQTLHVLNSQVGIGFLGLDYDEGKDALVF